MASREPGSEALSAYAPRHRGIETSATLAFVLLASFDLGRLARAVDSPERAALATGCALFAWIVTDFLSGLGHWTFDTWGRLDTPYVGRWFIRPFREHHVDPKAMTRHDFVETNGASCLAAIPVLAAAGLVALDDAASIAVQASLLFTALGALVSNQCHKWAHTSPARLGSGARLLQRLGLVLSPEQHRLHHGRSHDSHYCTASGWLNAPLHAIGFFRGLERVIATVFRVAPRQGDS